MKKRMDKTEQALKDCAAGNHGLYMAMKDAGLLHNGRFVVGKRFTDKKKQDKKNTCRGRVDF